MLDIALEKLRALPEDRQGAVVRQLLWIIEDEQSGDDPPLTDEEMKELERRMATPRSQLVPHEEVVALLEKKYGR